MWRLLKLAMSILPFSKLDNLCSQEPIKQACLCFRCLDLKHHVAMILHLYTCIIIFGFCFPDSSLLHAVSTFVVI